MLKHLLLKTEIWPERMLGPYITRRFVWFARLGIAGIAPRSTFQRCLLGLEKHKRKAGGVFLLKLLVMCAFLKTV